jgi:hypothetical protein
LLSRKKLFPARVAGGDQQASLSVADPFRAPAYLTDFSQGKVGQTDPHDRPIGQGGIAAVFVARADADEASSCLPFAYQAEGRAIKQQQVSGTAQGEQPIPHQDTVAQGIPICVVLNPEGGGLARAGTTAPACPGGLLSHVHRSVGQQKGATGQERGARHQSDQKSTTDPRSDWSGELARITKGRRAAGFRSRGKRRSVGRG